MAPLAWHERRHGDDMSDETKNETQTPSGRWVPAEPLPFYPGWLTRLRCWLFGHRMHSQRCVRCGKGWSR